MKCDICNSLKTLIKLSGKHTLIFCKECTSSVDICKRHDE